MALLDAAVRDLINRALAAVAEGGDDPVARFTNFVEAVVLNMTHHARQSALDSELRHVSPVNRRNYAATRKRLELMAFDLVPVPEPRHTARRRRALTQCCGGSWYLGVLDHLGRSAHSCRDRYDRNAVV